MVVADQANVSHPSAPFRGGMQKPPMWVRDHYFPEEYAHAGWHRLHMFFQLSGRVHWEKTYVEVELKRAGRRPGDQDQTDQTDDVRQGRISSAAPACSICSVAFACPNQERSRKIEEQCVPTCGSRVALLYTGV
jgi:hypothetical protein